MVTKEVTREVTVVVIATPRPPPTTPTPSPTPSNDTARLWLASLPSEASVYLRPGSRQGYKGLDDDLTQDKYLLGSTPLETKVSPGQYLLAVVVTVDQIESAGFVMLPSSHPLFNDAFEGDGNFSRIVHYDPPGEVASITKTYVLRTEAGESDALVSILIPLPERKLPQSPPYLY
ncbi:unnamed protein product, partial [marine sediment metagenome]